MANPTGKGGWAKGQSGNPAGRPHMLTAIAPMARKHSAAAIKTLVEIAEKGSPGSARVSAAVALLDRGFGRPAQSIELDLQLTKSLATMTLEELQQLRERYAAVAITAPVTIEHDATETAQPEEADNKSDDGEET
jgi:hypothetical protein